jgi:hypothetical protein
MAVTKEEILEAISAMGQEELQALREAVAPATKRDRIITETDALSQRVEQGRARAMNAIGVCRDVATADPKNATEPPSWDDLVKAFASE